MNTSELDYELPAERIARFPAERRDHSRLLVYDRASDSVEHAHFADLPKFLDRPVNFFRNNAAVLKGRIFAKKDSGGNVECLLLAPYGDPHVWTCMLKPAKRLKIGASFGVENSFRATVLEKFEDGRAVVKFDTADGGSVVAMSEKIGVVPLPPYIARDQHSPDYDRGFDNRRYETVYADPSKRVAAAAPTAGLHFTPELIDTLKSRGNGFFDLTLHVGIGTFQPLKSEVVEDHKMHSEIYEIPARTLAAMADKSMPRLAVGTTSLRAMEDFVRKHPDGFPTDKPIADSAELFVYPPQRIHAADAMITNFHLPRSTLMCLVAVFLKPDSDGGTEKLKELYRLAIEREYNFYSYGDAMLIL